MMARTLILMVYPPVLWERRPPVSWAQTHMSCTALLNLRLYKLSHTPYILLTSLGHHLYTMSVHYSSQVDGIYGQVHLHCISITMGKVDGCRLW